jgi:hypothetical protein
MSRHFLAWITPRLNGYHEVRRALQCVAVRLRAARCGSGYAPAIVLQTIVTSYVVTGLLLAAVVTVLDHHGAERHPGHSHATTRNEAGSEHVHGFEVLHLHPEPGIYAHHGVVTLPGNGRGLTTVALAENAPGAYIVAAASALPAILGLASAGWLLPPLPLTPVAVLTWASLLLAASMRHQVLFAPPLRPPAALAR